MDNDDLLLCSLLSLFWHQNKRFEIFFKGPVCSNMARELDFENSFYTGLGVSSLPFCSQLWKALQLKALTLGNNLKNPSQKFYWPIDWWNRVFFGVLFFGLQKYTVN